MHRSENVILAAALTLAIAVGALLGIGAKRPNERAGEFQRLVGGLGFGPAVNLEQCEFGFDPRLCSTCDHDLGPIPGGIFFCPDHAGTVSDAHLP